MPWFSPSPRPSQIRPHRPAPGLPGKVIDAASGCGWFDSSWELAQGLRIQEHTGFERLPPEVPLEWLLQ